MVATPLLSATGEVLSRIERADRVILALDFDGTLAPIAERPETAAMPRETAALLRDLAANDHLRIVILSGRALDDLRSRIDLDCILVGNHGLEISGGDLSFVHDVASRLRPAIECFCSDIEAALEGVGGVQIENKEFSATVHYRRAPIDLVEWIQATIHLVARPYAEWLVLKPARKAWEIRPRVAWNKGSALNVVLRSLPGLEPVVICAGDDVTDEDMFDVLPDCVSIQVGGRTPTAARYQVSGPEDLAVFLGALAAAFV